MEAAGPRPLLVIWIRQADDTPAAELNRRKQYYEDLIFGGPDRNPGYPEQVRSLEESVAGYYREMSGGKFAWKRAGFVGPLNAPVKDKKNAEEIAKLALTVAANQGHFNFRAFDTNHDGKITDKELAVLVISTAPEGQADHFGGDGFPIPGQGVAFAGKDAVTMEGGNFNGFNHELMHGLGAIDLYGPWSQFLDEVHGGCYYWNVGVSTMGGGIGNGGGAGDNDDLRSIHLDPWHKIMFGWAEPRLVPIGRAGSAQLAAQHVAPSAEPERRRPLLIYDPAKGASEFFILEYRTPAGLGYDRNVVTSGLVIWHIAYDRNGKPLEGGHYKNCSGKPVPVINISTRGAPDWKAGGSKAYAAADGDIKLKWLNGAESGLTVRVAPHKPSDPTIEVSWSPSNARQAGAQR
jgi:M6 family metalloprotease-like protein